MSVFISFIGRLGCNAETITMGGTSFITCRVAVDEIVKKEQQTRWITVNGSVDSFKNIEKYLTKGKLVNVRGIERVTPFTTKTGEPGVDTRVWADAIDFIPTGKQSEQGSKKDEQNSQITTGTVNIGQEAQDDDLPF